MPTCDADHSGLSAAGAIVRIARWAMGSIATVNEIKLNNLLYLTDFSEPAEAALPFVTAIAREYGSKIYACHILLPSVYACMALNFQRCGFAGLEQGAEAEMQTVESWLTSLLYETRLSGDPRLGNSPKDREGKQYSIRWYWYTPQRRSGKSFCWARLPKRSGEARPCLYSRSGPGVRCSQSGKGFHCVLFATDFTAEHTACAVCGLATMRVSGAPCPPACYPAPKRKKSPGELSASDAIYHLGQLVPTDARLCHRSELEVKYGAPAQNIIDTASRCGADLIVLEVRKGDVFGVATHVERTIVHEVVVKAPCPVLT